MLVMPIIFTYMSIETVLHNFQVNSFVVGVYLGSLLVGMLLGIFIANVWFRS